MELNEDESLTKSHSPISDLTRHSRVMDHSRPLHVQRTGRQRQWERERQRPGRWRVGGRQRLGCSQPGRAERPLGECEQGRHVGRKAWIFFLFQISAKNWNGIRLEDLDGDI